MDSSDYNFVPIQLGIMGIFLLIPDLLPGPVDKTGHLLHSWQYRTLILT